MLDPIEDADRRLRGAVKNVNNRRKIAFPDVTAPANLDRFDRETTESAGFP